MAKRTAITCSNSSKKIKKDAKKRNQRTPAPPTPPPTPTPTPSPPSSPTPSPPPPPPTPPPPSPFASRPQLLDNYTIHEKLGQGTYGCVYRATEIATGTPVAVKLLRGTYSRSECRALPEVRAQGQHLDHPNIVSLLDVVLETDGEYERGAATLVFDLMDRSLLEAVADHPPLTPDIQRITAHIATALHYMHQEHFFHRDLKPENIMLRGDTALLADFGFFCSFTWNRPFTEPAGSLWYQAPEVLLGSTSYGPEVDMWALGVTMVEMYLGGLTLFRGYDQEDQLDTICRALGCFDKKDWPEGVTLARRAGYRRPKEYQESSIESLLRDHDADEDAIHLIVALLSWNPKSRPTAEEVLTHPFVHSLVETESDEDCID